MPPCLFPPCLSSTSTLPCKGVFFSPHSYYWGTSRWRSAAIRLLMETRRKRMWATGVAAEVASVISELENKDRRRRRFWTKRMFLLYGRLALPSWNSAVDCLQWYNDTPSMPPLVPVGSVRYILPFKRCCFSWTLSKTEFWKPVICRVLEVNLTTSGGGLGVVFFLFVFFYSILQIFYTSHLTLMYRSADRLCSPQTVAVITTYKSKQCQVIISNPQGL